MFVRINSLNFVTANCKVQVTACITILIQWLRCRLELTRSRLKLDTAKLVYILAANLSCIWWQSALAEGCGRNGGYYLARHLCMKLWSWLFAALWCRGSAAAATLFLTGCSSLTSEIAAYSEHFEVHASRTYFVKEKMFLLTNLLILPQNNEKIAHTRCLRLAEGRQRRKMTQRSK